MITKTALLKKALPKDEQISTWNQWQDSTYDYDKREYDYPEFPKHIVILYEHYQYEDYSGYGHVIGYDKEKDSFFEIYGSHCSCYGLEGQWEPEYTTIEEMLAHTAKRIESAKERDWHYSEDGELEQLKAFLEI